MVGNAGVIESEVVLVSKKSEEDDVRWVYLDIGKFGGLAETMDELIRYPIRTPRDGDTLAPCVLAGPTCDSADVLYEKNPYPLPVSLGDRRPGADRRHRRLHGDVLRSGLQRLRAAEDVPHLTRIRVGSRHLADSPFREPAWPAPLSAARVRARKELTMVTIRNERVSDAGAREALLDVAYGDVRFTKPSHKLREGRLPADGLSLVATEDGRIVGSVRLWHVRAGGRPMRCCWVRWRSIRTAATAASARR